MDAQVVVVAQPGEHGAGEGPDPDLEGGAVGDHRGDALRDPDLDRVRGFRHQLPQRSRHRDDRRDATDVEPGVTQRVWHLIVHLDQHARCVGGGGEGAVGAGAEGQEPVLIRGRGLDQRDVDAQLVGEETFDLAERHRGVVGAPLGHRRTHVLAEEQAVVAQVTGELRAEILEGTEGHHVADLDVPQLLPAPPAHPAASPGSRGLAAPRPGPRDGSAGRRLRRWSAGRATPPPDAAGPWPPPSGRQAPAGSLIARSTDCAPPLGG